MPTQALQTSKFDSAPFSQVIYRALPKWESLDPFGEAAQRQLRLTNVRIRLLQRQPCPCQAKDLGSAHQDLPTRHFAIYDLIVKGSCFCNGHAEQCVPAPGYQPIRDRTQHVVREKKLANFAAIESFTIINLSIHLLPLYLESGHGGSSLKRDPALLSARLAGPQGRRPAERKSPSWVFQGYIPLQGGLQKAY